MQWSRLSSLHNTWNTESCIDVITINIDVITINTEPKT